MLTVHPDSTVDLSAGGDIDRLRLVMLRAARRIRTGATGDITPSQLAVLGTVLRHERVTVGQIAEYEHVAAPSASKIVAALERHGLVERATDPSDRRVTLISATEAGHTYADEVRAASRTWLAEQLEQLDIVDLRAIEQALPALERLLATGQ